MWSPKDGPTIQLWKKKCCRMGKTILTRVRILLLFIQNGELKNWGHVKRKGSLVTRFRSILSSRSLGCQRIICMLALKVLMWNIARACWSCYQGLSHDKVMLCWKAFGLLAIGRLIMNVHPFVSLLMWTLKILSSFHTMDL